MTYRIALVGCGAIVDKHLQAIKQVSQTSGYAQAVAAADVQLSRVHAAAAAYGEQLEMYTDYKQMIREVQPDIVIITLPHHLHREAACFAADYGCHLLLEKPMALNAAECDTIIRKVKQNNVQLLVGHTQHYIKENLEAKRIIVEGSLGKLVMLHDVRHIDYFAASRPDWFFRKALSGGGIAFNLGSHSIDKAMWLAGAHAASIKASVSYYGNRGDTEGSLMAYVQLQNDVPASIVQSGYKGAPSNYTELLFTKGSMRLETGRGLYRSQGGAYEPVELPDLADPFVLQLEDLITSIKTGMPPTCTMEYSKHVIEVLEALYLSSRSGQEERIV